MDLVVVIRVRQRFGSDDDENGLEQNAPFRRSVQGVLVCMPRCGQRIGRGFLVFQAQHVVHSRNKLSINRVDIAGGVPLGGFFVGPPLGNPPNEAFPGDRDVERPEPHHPAQYAPKRREHPPDRGES